MTFTRPQKIIALAVQLLLVLCALAAPVNAASSGKTALGGYQLNIETTLANVVSKSLTAMGKKLTSERRASGDCNAADSGSPSSSGSSNTSNSGSGSSSSTDAPSSSTNLNNSADSGTNPSSGGSTSSNTADASTGNSSGSSDNSTAGNDSGDTGGNSSRSNGSNNSSNDSAPNSGPTINEHRVDGPLNWSGVDPNGLSRKDHIRRHDADEPSRNVAHGVFNDNSINQTADAWQKAKDLNIEPSVQGNRLIYDVPAPNAGTQGGNPSLPGHGQPLDTIRIVVEAGNNKVITAFPK